MENTIQKLFGAKRTIDKIIIHCAATRPTQNIDAATIDCWHKQRGWKGIGYHAVIKRSGEIELGRNVSTIGAHCKGHNEKSIGICLVGGIDENKKPSSNYTDEQWKTLRQVLITLMRHYKLTDQNVYGHSDFANKACPCFNVRNWLRSMTWN